MIDKKKPKNNWYLIKVKCNKCGKLFTTTKNSGYVFCKDCVKK